MSIWRDRLGRWLERPARHCPISPNSITLVALALAMIGATGTALARTLPELLAALVIVVIAGLCDAFDGIVARVQGKSSRFGDFLDHLCDRVADVSLTIGWLIGAGVRPILCILATAMVLLNGYAGTQIEASFAKRSYDGAGRGEFMIGIVALPIISHFTRGIDVGGFSISEVLAILLMVAAFFATLQRVALARRLADEADA